MIVKKANVIQHMGKPCIELCRWCKTDTLQPCNLYKEPELCRVECVIAYGVREAGIFDTVRNVTSAKLTPTLTQQQVTAAKDAESSSSDSDAPITKAAIAMAKASAARPRVQPVVSNELVLNTVRRFQAQREEVCDGPPYCICRKCTGY
jgi:hypothetical protein